MQPSNPARAAAPATALTIERRFPLDLRQSDLAIRALYEESKQGRWNPQADIPWDAFDASAFDAATLDAAARLWSRRAWLEYSGMAETPALIIRFCLELDREADPKYFLTVRNTEEAWHVESFGRYAQLCGQYHDSPANPQWAPLFNRNLYRDALDASRSLDGHVLTHCLFVDGLEHALADAWLANTREPVARAILERCSAARSRHARFGELYVQRRAPQMSEHERATAIGALAAYLQEVELAGAHCVGLASTIDATADIAHADRVAAAGLGAVTAAAEIGLFRQYLADRRRWLTTLGLQLPLLQHPTLGPI